MIFTFLLPFLLFQIINAQYGIYGTGYGGSYGGYSVGVYPIGGMPFMPSPYGQMYGEIEKNQRDCRGLPSMRARSICRYGNPMMGNLGATGSGMYESTGICTDLNPQCSVWASTGQCATNPMMMRQACALSCGTCATGLGSSFLNNPFSLGMPPNAAVTGLGQYPLSQFIGRSIYETGILRQPTPHISKEIIEKQNSGYLLDRRRK